MVSQFLVDVSDLYFKISPDGLKGSVITDEGFTYIWAGAKTTWGVNKGKVCYECKVGLSTKAVLLIDVIVDVGLLQISGMFYMFN